MDLSFELTAPKKKGHNSIKKREAYIAGRMNRLCGLFIRLIKEGILPISLGSIPFLHQKHCTFEQNKLAKTRIISDFAQKQTENGWKWKKCFVIIVSNKKS